MSSGLRMFVYVEWSDIDKLTRERTGNDAAEEIFCGRG